MRLLSTLLFAILCLSFNSLQAQVSKDATVPMTATLNTGPIGITLTWANPGNANLLILRRTKGQAGNAWVQLINVTASNLTSLTDNGVANGQIYEYVIQRTLGTLNAFGYAHVAVNANPVTTRGKVLIFADSTTANALSVELARLENDLRGDGWWPISFKTGPSSTVQSVKNQIIASHNADPLNVKSVLLLGNIPIPYSGNANWDGHAEHAGAWPSDAYYADVNGIWTDVSINNVTPARAANVNIPGDGKFDQSYMPTAAELQVGRVDFRRLNAPAFGAADAVGLMKRYLDKNHKWRIGDYAVQNKALVDDNFGYFGGEAFAANGFRNAYPLVGEANIIETDFFNGTESQTYLLGYGTGGGSYQSAGGVGSSANFATDSVNIVFSNLFGSYHGDWDFESDPFMPAALASRGGILTCSWAGRPHWFNQALASGETIGYCNWETMNAQFNNGFLGSFGKSGAHVALLGDPTLRANVVKPATNLALAAPTCNTVVLNWTASADAVSGYHVYRALSPNGTYARLTTTPITATTYTDLSPLLDTLYYQVRAIKNVTNPGGGTYANNAIGPIQSIVFVAAGGPTLTTAGGTLNCVTSSVTLTTSASAPVTTWAWTGPNNFSSNQQSPSVSNVGTYSLTATDAAGCSATATAVVVGNYTVPILTATVSNTINCANTTATITVSAAGLSACTIFGPGNLLVQDFTATVSLPGTYTISIVSSDNGCIASGTVQVIANNVIPTVTASNSGPITCGNISSQLIATSSIPGTTFAWSGPCLNGTTATCPGVYTVTVTNSANGCTNSASSTVAQDITPPSVSAQSGIITCNNPTVWLNAVVSPNTTSTLWSGPCVVPGNPPAASCAGVYTVVAISANGCTNSASMVVTEDTQLPNFNLPAAVLSCLSPCALFTVPDLPGFQVIYQGQVIPPGASIQICDPGQITITIKSIATGCTKDIELTISQDTNVPSAVAGQDVTISCNAPTAQLSSAGSSVGASFTLLWTGPNGFSSGQPNPVVSAPGTYTLLITNTTNGCINTDVVQVLADPNLPTASPDVSGQINCANPTVQLSSGNNTPGVTYAWSPSTGLSCTTCPNPVASLPGTYTVVVSVGTCAASGSVVVVKAPELVVTTGNATVGCDGATSICLSVVGGTPPYTYLWSNGNTTICANYVEPIFSVNVMDAGGCVFQGPNIVITQIPEAVLTTTVVNESAPNANNGSIDLSVSGGAGGNSYVWSNGATTQDLTALGAGTYSVTVTDIMGCTQTTSATVGTMVGTTETALFEQFLLSPNPTVGPALLSLKLHKSAAIRVEVRDLAGRVVLKNPLLEASTLNLPIDLGSSSAGVYSISVWIDNQVFVHKLVVVR
jgi:hypothetical protein